MHFFPFVVEVFSRQISFKLIAPHEIKTAFPVTKDPNEGHGGRDWEQGDRGSSDNEGFWGMTRGGGGEREREKRTQREETRKS